MDSVSKGAAFDQTVRSLMAHSSTWPSDMERHYRAILARFQEATRLAVVEECAAHLRRRAAGFRAAAKKQQARVGPMAKGFDWAALEIESALQPKVAGQ